MNPPTFSFQQALDWIQQTQPTARLVNISTPETKSVCGVSTDSRTVAHGNLFVALKGERFDAHDFLSHAELQSKACGVIAEHLPSGFSLPAIIVPNTLQALGALARGWRQQFADLQLIAVTGSNGKTTVKEMLASILRVAYGEVHSLATRGNLNNEIGVPLTLLRLHADLRGAAVELGMNHVGEIAYLAALARPTIALVNNAQREHQEFMQSVEAVARENGSVFASVAATPMQGAAVFPADDEFTPLWRELAQHCQVFDFALRPGVAARVTASVSELSASGYYDLILHTPAADAACRLQAAGLHNVRNALAATACALAANIPLAAIAQGLEQFNPVNGRLQFKQTAQGLRVIDDTYNANPDSVLAAIDVLAQCTGNTVLVLGDMGEVGEQGAAFHAEVGAYAKAKGIQHVCTYGPLSRHVAEACGANAAHAESADHLSELLRKVLADCVIQNTTVLVKGSRFMRMEQVVEWLFLQYR